jgi:hypothetical protein
MYVNAKTYLLKLFQELGEGGRAVEGVNSSITCLINCKNLCTTHSTTIIKIIDKKKRSDHTKSFKKYTTEQ